MASRHRFTLDVLRVEVFLSEVLCPHFLECFLGDLCHIETLKHFKEFTCILHLLLCIRPVLLLANQEHDRLHDKLYISWWII